LPHFPYGLQAATSVAEQAIKLGKWMESAGDKEVTWKTLKAKH
jgi:hypothetical protein